MVETHPACHHPLFSYVREHAAGLNSAQVDVFSRAMMARIYPTVPHIAELLAHAVRKGDHETARTAAQNIEEELGLGDPSGLTHPQMAEIAFNALREAFSLPPLTLKEAYENRILPESFAHAAMFDAGYREFPEVAFWLQERASGGFNASVRGMMQNLKESFDGLHASGRISDEQYARAKPWFGANVAESLETMEKGVEHQHGQRAEADARRALCCPEKAAKALPFAVAFLNAQSALFDETMQAMQKLASVEQAPVATAGQPDTQLVKAFMQAVERTLNNGRGGS